MQVCFTGRRSTVSISPSCASCSGITRRHSATLVRRFRVAPEVQQYYYVTGPLENVDGNPEPRRTVLGDLGTTDFKGCSFQKIRFPARSVLQAFGSGLLKEARSHFLISGGGHSRGCPSLTPETDMSIDPFHEGERRVPLIQPAHIDHYPSHLCPPCQS